MSDTLSHMDNLPFLFRQLSPENRHTLLSLAQAAKAAEERGIREAPKSVPPARRRPASHSPADRGPWPPAEPTLLLFRPLPQPVLRHNAIAPYSETARQPLGLGLRDWLRRYYAGQPVNIGGVPARIGDLLIAAGDILPVTCYYLDETGPKPVTPRFEDAQTVLEDWERRWEQNGRE